MPMTALDLTEGITEYSSRISLKMLFGQFGVVSACWIPPLEHRGTERAYVKFGTEAAAKAALYAAEAGQLYLDGVNLKAQWRMTPSRTQDTRDFEARGSNLMTSRDLMRASVRGRKDRDEKRKDEKKRDRSKARDRSRDRDRKRKSRSRDRRRRDRSRERSKSGRRSRSKSRSRSRSRAKKRSPSVAAVAEKSIPIDEPIPALEDAPEEGLHMEDGGTSAVL